MIHNFDEVRSQLKDLAEVLNSYKSEAVQLRLVELIFGAGPKPPPAPVAAQPSADAAGTGSPARGGRRSAKKARSPSVSAPASSKPRSGGSGKNGPRSTLTALYDEGFFKTPRTLGQVVEHCDRDLALKFKSSDFSGPLARYTRDKRLKRVKNADGQYEYTQAG